MLILELYEQYLSLEASLTFPPEFEPPADGLKRRDALKEIEAKIVSFVSRAGGNYTIEGHNFKMFRASVGGVPHDYFTCTFVRVVDEGQRGYSTALAKLKAQALSE